MSENSQKQVKQVQGAIDSFKRTIDSVAASETAMRDQAASVDFKMREAQREQQQLKKLLEANEAKFLDKSEFHNQVLEHNKKLTEIDAVKE